MLTYAPAARVSDIENLLAIGSVAMNEAVDLWVRGRNANRQWCERRLTGDTIESAVREAAPWFTASELALGHPGGFSVTDVTVTDEGKATDWYLRVVITTEETGTFGDMQPGRQRRTTLEGRHTVPPIRRTWTIKRHGSEGGEAEMRSHTTDPAKAVLENAAHLREQGLLPGEYRPNATPYSGTSIRALGGGAHLVGIYTWIDGAATAHEFEVRAVLDRGGRPSVDGEPGRTKTVPIALGTDLTSRADATAEAEGISRAELVRRAVRAYIDART
ncbi:CopG family transcriptional regulator [Nocardia sp. NPDC050435]|uniref:ribbon-helix-helix domain-containing protein n=1 Tax=Nocardia sp. NPDC050435 TaxID=3155040 RepID=UPI0033DDBD73